MVLKVGVPNQQLQHHLGASYKCNSQAPPRRADCDTLGAGLGNRGFDKPSRCFWCVLEFDTLCFQAARPALENANWPRSSHGLVVGTDVTVLTNGRGGSAPDTTWSRAQDTCRSSKLASCLLDPDCSILLNTVLPADTANQLARVHALKPVSQPCTKSHFSRDQAARLQD